MTAKELCALVAAQLADCTPEQHQLFERRKVTPYLIPIDRDGKTDAVFVVAKADDMVLYYEDIEEGFNLSPLSLDGSISNSGFEQWELGHALGHLAAFDRSANPKPRHGLG